MKTKRIFIYGGIITLFSFLFFVGCKDEPVIPDTPIIKFSENVQPLIIGNCTASGCHGSANTQDFVLYSYEDVINNGKVKPYDAKGSELYRVIISNIKAVKMPREPYPDLTEEQIEIIYLWIMQGAKNN